MARLPDESGLVWESMAWAGRVAMRSWQFLSRRCLCTAIVPIQSERRGQRRTSEGARSEGGERANCGRLQLALRSS